MPVSQQNRLDAFPKTLITKHHNLGGFEECKFIISQFWRTEVWNQGLARLVPSGSSEGACPMPLSWLPVVAGTPWQSLAYRGFTPISSHRHMAFSLCVWVQISFFLWGRPNPLWPHLNLITSAKNLFAYKVTFTGTGVRTWTYILRGHDSTHYIPQFSTGSFAIHT